MKTRYTRTRINKQKSITVSILLFFIFLTVFVFISVYCFKYAFCNIRYFTIKQIEISKTYELSQDKLKERINGFIGKQLYKVQIDSIAHYFDDLERIKSLQIQRKFPNAISIKIKERRAHFYYKTSSGELYPISEDNVILSNSNIQYDLPIVSGFEIRNLKAGVKISHPKFNIILSLVNAIKEMDENLLSNISEFYFEDGELCFVEYQNTCKIIVGNDNFDRKLQKFLCVYKSLGIECRKIYDLRFSNQIILRIPEG